MERVRYVLEQPLMNLNLREVAKQTDLQFDQIATLCKDKLAKSKFVKSQTMPLVKIQQSEMY